MRVVFFSAKPYDKQFFENLNKAHHHELHFLDVPLHADTAVLARSFDVVCIFVNDEASLAVIQQLADLNVQLLALRSAGYNHVDLTAAQKFKIPVVRVPAYSPYSVAEHTLALVLTLNRKTHRAYNRIREGNFSLNGLMGFDLHDKTVGLIGLGKIGFAAARIFKGLGCRVLGYDVLQQPEGREIGLKYTDLATIYSESDIISLHCPLTPDTFHIVNKTTIAQMKRGVMLINTSRGALIDTIAVIEGLKHEQIGYLGLDVYEEEGDLFFADLSDKVIQDDVFTRLLAFPNVLITGHQAFFTQNALHKIAEVTLQNITAFAQKEPLPNAVK
ncbi:2-hydroxyacid dehydrogenase [Adhaeribacter pallidiroseus]|uniref:D-lactate dehydrogenase n=1 Tax=Adhaeribacter pallidiroseus TaxID=2072847 RepID=A0A369QIW7_9BACT|nr:2-hydroxyacid dehydrogenase [Adhaeribacter pallidiroseus]RDC64664.1 D-lactate dehydrogenase [Adhaeribacter pallidiroseus]